MNRRERMERRAEKRREWAESRRRRADAAFSRVEAITSQIPLGQPILVGHHSEGRARADQKRIETGMRTSIESANMAARHDQKADTLEDRLETCTFSDDSDAVEQLQAKITAAEKRQATMKAVNQVIRAKPKGVPTDAKIAKLGALGLSETVARKSFEPDCCGRVGFPGYALTNNNANIRRMKGRITEIQRMNARKEAADLAGGVSVEGGEYVRVTFADRPEREILTALKAAGFHWGGGSWVGRRDSIPACVTEMTN